MEFNAYWELLLEIKENSDVEQYYDEMLRPLFKDVIKHINNVKVVPTYDTRNYRKENNKYGVITGSKENFVWADYIFVPTKYTHINPLKPYVKVEFKRPNFIIDKNTKKIQYCSIIDTARNLGLNKFKNEIEGELEETPLILTDGIEWYFFKSKEDLLKNNNDNKISLLKKENIIRKGSSISYAKIIENPNHEFTMLKNILASFIEKNIK